MCHDLWVALFSIPYIIKDLWTTFVWVPWKQCTRQRKCYWWCLCCNKWACWIGLILVAVLVIVFIVLFVVWIFVLLVVCEIICILLTIFTGGEAKVTCFAYSSSSSSSSGSSMPPPPPPPTGGSGSGTGNQPR